MWKYFRPTAYEHFEIHQTLYIGSIIHQLQNVFIGMQKRVSHSLSIQCTVYEIMHKPFYCSIINIICQISV